MAVRLFARDMGIGALQIDPAYQRVIVPSQVKWIINHYDEVAFGRLLVAEREGPDGGSFWVVDGQQRLTAARELEMDKIPCLVFKSQGRQHEASVFKEVNASRSLVRPIDVFRASLEAREPEAVAISAITSECGYKICNMARTEPVYWKNIQSVAALRDLYRRGGADLLRLVLVTVGEMWAGDIQAVNGLVLTGVGVLLQRVLGLPEFEYQRLLTKGKRQSPGGILRSVKDLTRMLGGRQDRARTFAAALLVAYNKGLRKGKLVVPGLSLVIDQSPEPAE